MKFSMCIIVIMMSIKPISVSYILKMVLKAQKDELELPHFLRME